MDLSVASRDPELEPIRHDIILKVKRLENINIYIEECPGDLIQNTFVINDGFKTLKQKVNIHINNFGGPLNRKFV